MQLHTYLLFIFTIINCIFIFIKGLKCEYKLCKKCCRSKCYLEIADCPGHRILIKTKKNLSRHKEGIYICMIIYTSISQKTMIIKLSSKTVSDLNSLL